MTLGKQKSWSVLRKVNMFSFVNDRSATGFHSLDGWDIENTVSKCAENNGRGADVGVVREKHL